MPETPPVQPVEVVESPRSEISDQIAEVFERKAHVKNGQIRKLYMQRFNELVNTALPEKDRNKIMIKLQKLEVSIRGIVAEFGSRFADYVRNIVSWPLIKADPTFPKDKYRQKALAEADALMGFRLHTTKTATAERNALKKNFLATILQGVGYGSLLGGIPAAIVVGAKTGATAGAMAGVEGAAIGAVGGGIVGGLTTLVFRIKDKILGPPAAYYDPGFKIPFLNITLHGSAPAPMPIPGKSMLV